MRATVFAAFGAILFLARLAAAQEFGYLPVPVVDRSRLAVEGAKTFTAEQIKDALWTDLDLALAGILPSTAGEKPRLLIEKTIAGYRHAGFLHVQAWLDPDGRLLTVDEGPRFNAGAVHVEGTKMIDAGGLIDALKRPQAGESTAGPHWPTGKAAWFDQPSEARLAKRIASLSADQGFYQPSFFVRTECDSATNTATLVIDFAEERQATKLGDVLIVGNHQNSREEIFKYLDVGVDATLTGELCAQIINKLNASGRFVRCQWQLDELAQRVDGWQPKLMVEEYGDAPALSEALSREEAALVKFSQWVGAFDSSDDEVAISFRGADEWFDVVLAPREGFIALNGKCGDDRQHSPCQAAVVISEKQVGLYSVAQRRKVVAVPPPAHMTANASVIVVDGAPKWDGRSRLMCGIGMHSKARTGTRRHLKLELSQTASGALSVVRNHQASCSWDGDVLTAQWNHRTLRIDATTGRLVEQVVMDESKGKDEDAATASGVRTLTVHGEYARRLAEVEAAAADFENRADAKRPLSCVAEFICDELNAQRRLELLPACRGAMPVLKKLAAGGFFGPFDDLLLRIKEPATESFWIPTPPGSMTKFDDWYSATKWLATYFGLWSGDSLFGQKSWITDIWRGQVILLAREQLAMPGSFGDDLTVYEPFPPEPPHRGPLWALTAAELLRWQGLNSSAGDYAKQGLRTLSARDFRRDYSELLSGNGLASEYLLNVADALRNLDPRETKTLIDALVELKAIDAETAQRCVAVLSLLHAADQQPIGEAVAHVLDQCWKHGLSNWVDERLQYLANLADSSPRVLVGPGQPGKQTNWPPVAGQPVPSTYPGGVPGGYFMSPDQPYAIAPTYGRAPSAPSAGAGYGAAVYNTTPDIAGYGPAPAAPNAFPAEPTTQLDVHEEIGQIRALMRSMAYRLAELESRMPPADDEAEDGIRKAQKPTSGDAK